jgi:hypothetical protein
MHRIWIILAEKTRGTVIESRQAPLQWSLEGITFTNQVAFSGAWNKIFSVQYSSSIKNFISLSEHDLDPGRQ